MKTILLIDEDEASRQSLRKFLAVDGWEVVEAKDGAAGLALAGARQPAVIVCDLLLRGLNGFQLCKELRARPELQQATLVATSMRDYPSDRQGAKEAGAQHYLAKPVNLMALKGILDQVKLPEPENAGPDRIARNIPLEAPTRLKFWGVRGSIPAPGKETARFGGNTSCVEVRTDGELIILDAGSGIRPLGLALAREFKGRPLEMTLLITHTHWDHIQGFPFFVPAYHPQNTVRVLGYEGARRSLQETLSGQMESPYFPIGLKEMPGNIIFVELRDLNFTVGRVRVQAMYVNHPGICVGYRLYTSDGSITYIPDNEQYQRLKSFPAGGGPGQANASMEYARQQDQKLMEFVMNSDILIIDSQYDEKEYESHVGWGHSCVDDAVTLAMRAGVKHLFLFHHDPAHEDARIAAMVRRARQLAAAQNSRLVVEGAREGLEVVLRQTVRKRGGRGDK